LLADPLFYALAIPAVVFMGLAKAASPEWVSCRLNRVSADRFYTLIYLLLIAVGSQLVSAGFQPRLGAVPPQPRAVGDDLVHVRKA
jgi:hypothetical protein